MVSFPTPASLVLSTVLLLALAATAQAQGTEGEPDAGGAAAATIAVYGVQGTGIWEDIPESLFVLAAPRIPFLDAEGYARDVHPVVVDRPHWHNGSWVQAQEQRFYGHDGTWIARVVEHEGASEPDSVVPGVVGARHDQAQVLTYMRGIEDCLMIPAHHESFRCIMPFWPETVWEAKRVRNEWDGGDEPTVVVQARWGEWLLEAWHHPSAPVAGHVEVVALGPQVLSSLTLTLEEHQAWGQEEPARPERVLDPLVRVAATQTDPILAAPSEAGLQHSFPLSAAIQILMEDDVVSIDARGDDGCGSNDHTFQEWLETYPQPFVYHAEHRRLAGDRTGHEWLLGFSNGHTTFWLVVARVDEAGLRAPDLARGVCGDFINSAFGSIPIGDYAIFVDQPAHIDPYIPDLHDVQTHLPTVQQLVDWWEAFSGQDAPTDPSYGYHVGCTGCAPRTWSFWAGDAVANVSHEDPLSLHLGYDDDLAYDATLLHLDGDGRATSLVHTGYSESFRIPGLPSLPNERSAADTDPSRARGQSPSATETSPRTPEAPASGPSVLLAGIGAVSLVSLAAAFLRRQR